MAYALPAAQYISSVAYAAVSAWAAGHAYSAGNLVRQNAAPAVGGERVFACTTAGTSGGTEPTWVVTRGTKSPASGSDGSVVWFEATGWPGLNGDTAGNQPVWTASSTPPLGQVIYDSSTTSLQVCTISAAGSGTKPAFSATAGSTKADGSATWTSLGAASGFSAYAAPYARLATALANTSNNFPSPTNVYADKNHAETQATSVSMSAPSTVRFNVISVDPAVAPPTTYTPGASINTTSTGQINFGSGTATSAVLFAGITFNSNSSMSFGAGENSTTMFQDCAINSINSGSTGSPSFSGANGGSRIFLKNTSFNFTEVLQGISVSGVTLIWKGGAITGVSNVLILTQSTTGVLAGLVIEGVDFSGSPSGANILSIRGEGSATFKDCKLASGQVLVGGPGKPMIVDGVNIDSGGTQYQMQRTQANGSISTQTAVVRTTGVSMAGQAVAHFYSMTAGNNVAPPQGFPAVEWNPNTAANVTVTMYGVALQAAMPKTGDIYLHITYPGSASSPLSSVVETTSVTPLAPVGVSLTADTSAWDSGGAARLNLNNYGSFTTPPTTIVTTSNPGRVFFLTQTGVSAGSEPPGYASAMDGDVIPDGTAKFQAGWRFKMVGVLSSPQPALAGYIYATPFVPGTVTLVLDPTIALS